PVYDALARRVNLLSNPSRVSGAGIRWLLRQGGEREPRKVLEQVPRWIRRGELTCYRAGDDYNHAFANLSLPLALGVRGKPPLPHGLRGRGHGSARLGGVDPARVPRGPERVPPLAAGEGEQPHRADDGARHPADLLRREESRGVRAHAPEPGPLAAAPGGMRF